MGTINHRLSRCSTKTDQLDEHEDSNGFYGQCPSQTESKCLTEEQGITSEEYEIRNTVRKLFQKYFSKNSYQSFHHLLDFARFKKSLSNK